MQDAWSLTQRPSYSSYWPLTRTAITAATERLSLSHCLRTTGLPCRIAWADWDTRYASTCQRHELHIRGVLVHRGFLLQAAAPSQSTCNKAVCPAQLLPSRCREARRQLNTAILAQGKAAVSAAAVAEAPRVNLVPKPVTSVLNDLAPFLQLPSLGKQSLRC